MPSYKNYFASKYLKVDDLKGRRVPVTIQGVEPQDVNGDEKLIVYFNELKQGLVLNRTNAGSIEEIVGADDWEEWVGKPIVLYPSKTDYQGKRVPCIRIEASKQAAAVGFGRPAKKGEPAPDAAVDDDNIPF